MTKFEVPNSKGIEFQRGQGPRTVRFRFENFFRKFVSNFFEIKYEEDF